MIEKIQVEKRKNDLFVLYVVKMTYELELKFFNQFKDTFHKILGFQRCVPLSLPYLIRGAFLTNNIEALCKAIDKWQVDRFVLDTNNLYIKLFHKYKELKKGTLTKEDLREFTTDYTLSAEGKSIVCYLMALLVQDPEEKLQYLELGHVAHTKNYGILLEGLKVGHYIGKIKPETYIALDLEYLKYIPYNTKESSVEGVEFYVVGGGNVIGGSCYIMKFKGLQVMIDAGVQFGKEEEVLHPNFQLLEDFGIKGLQEIDALFLTHAHLDHAGAMVEIYKTLEKEGRKLPIYMTPATKSLIGKNLISIIDKDAFSMDRYYLEKCLQEAIEIDFREPFTLKKGQNELEVEFFRAGHILGAAAIYFSFCEKGILFTGDYCLHDQYTVKGMEIPKDYKVDLLITETTYGAARYTDRYPREVEEKLLLNYIVKNVENNKKALIPSFALGRAQEVILLLKEYFRSCEGIPFRVYMDGMVTEISEIFEQYTPYVFLEKGIFQANHNQGYPSKAAFIEGEVMQHKCCVIASSGMLKDGSTSSYYAEKLVEDSTALCILTGYQDEESVGRKVKQLMEQEGNRYIEINDTIHKVRCEIAEYYLSAHCQIEDIIQVVLQVKPQKVCLIHGTALEEEKSIIHQELSKLKNLQVIQSINGCKYIF